ncbi:MAG: hypothetical protein OEY03_03850 [Rhizobacter sp.]|nr:hypothetical protein [Rhizobacter sp.]
MNTPTRIFAIALALLSLAAGAMPAHAHGRHGSPGLFWGGVGIGVGLGSHYHYRQRHPGQGHAYHQAPTMARETGGAPAPDPIFDPGRGQSAAQTETDRQDCNRRATTQPSAMADASVFHRASLTCMAERGYIVR